MNVRPHQGFNQQTAEEAVELVLPMIEHARRNHAIGARDCLYIVIMDPAAPPARVDFEQAILYEHAFGDRSRWDADYAGFARARARLSWCSGVGSHVAQETRPYLLTAHDTDFSASSVIEGITVSVSGAHPWYDEAFAGCVALCLKAIAREKAGVRRDEPCLLSPTA